MRNLTVLGLLLGILSGFLLVYRSTNGICAYDELIFTSDCRNIAPFDAFGSFTGRIEDGVYLFQIAYLRNATSFVTENVTVSLEMPDFFESEEGKIYYVSTGKGSKAGSYRALALEEYDELVLDFKGFYDVCWDYDCTGEVPWEKKEEKKRFFLRGSGGSYTSGVLTSAKVPARGNVSVLTIFLYEGRPLLGEERASLESAIEYVEEWYGTRAKMVAGYEILDVKIKFHERQMPIQEDYNPCSANEIKSVVSEISGATDYDVLALVYVLEKSSGCPPYPSDDMISLFIRRDGLDVKSEVDTLVRSFAHEIAHVFGARDKYTGVREWESGIRVGCKFEPEMLGRDIMCHRVPEGAGESFGYINPPLEGLYIKGPTARELGWYDGDGDGVIEVVDPCPMDGRDVCVMAGTSGE